MVNDTMSPTLTVSLEDVFTRVNSGTPTRTELLPHSSTCSCISSGPQYFHFQKIWALLFSSPVFVALKWVVKLSDEPGSQLPYVLYKDI